MSKALSTDFSYRARHRYRIVLPYCVTVLCYRIVSYSIPWITQNVAKVFQPYNLD